MQRVRGPDPHFVGQHAVRLGVVVRDHQRVRPFLRIVKVVFAAVRRDGCRQRGQLAGLGGHRRLQRPAGDVQAMDAVVAQIAGPVIEEPPPGTVKTAWIEGPQGSGAKPAVVVDTRRRRSVRRIADRALAGALPRLGKMHFAQMPCGDPGHRFALQLSAASLGPQLDDTLILAGRRDHRAPFQDVVAVGFLDVHILAGLAGVDRGQGVPMIRRSDHQRVHAGILQRRPVVNDRLRLLAGRFLNLLDPRRQGVGVHIANVLDVHIRLGGKRVQQCPAPAPHSHHGNRDAVVGRGPTQRSRGPCRSQADGRLQDISPFHALPSFT